LRLVPPPVLTSFEPCRKIQETEQEIAELKRKGHEELRLLIEQLQHDLEKAKHDYEELQANHASAETAWRSEVATLREQAARQRETIDSLTQTLEEVREELAARDRAERSRERLSKAAKKLEGRLWQRKVLQDAPRFRSLGERHTAVISVLNLKGGVGKTTVTAHLGAAFASKGYRVLLVDLDLQGSLSGLFINETVLMDLSQEQLLLQHYLINAAEKRKADLRDYCVPIFDGNSAIVPSADSMAYAELREVSWEGRKHLGGGQSLPGQASTDRNYLVLQTDAARVLLDRGRCRSLVSRHNHALRSLAADFPGPCSSSRATTS